MNSLAPRDATMYWLSTRTRNDLFLLYCFADTGVPTAELRTAIAERTTSIPDLLVRVLDVPANLAYPRWTPCEFADSQFVEHVLEKSDWSELLAALGKLVDTSLDAADRPWLLHLFRGVADAPTATGPVIVAVLQLSHALADGRRAADLARALFTEHDEAAPIPLPLSGNRTAVERVKDRDQAGDGRSSRRSDDRRHGTSAGPSTPDDATAARGSGGSAGKWAAVLPDRVTSWFAAATALPRIPLGMARTVFRGYTAYRAQRELAELTERNELPPPASGYPPNLLHGNGAVPGHSVRMLVFDTADLRTPGRTVTVVALTAVSLTLQRYLSARGEPADALGAQVPMAVPGNPGGQRNSYRDLSVDLAIDEPDLCRRADRIAATMATRRTRATHPLHAAQDAVTAALPALLLHRDVTTYPIDILPDQVSGHTVVSSVHRGPADLTLGNGRVHFTAGFPALGSVMHLTHGIHGLGDTVTFSVHADPVVIPDPDTYVRLLSTAVTEVVAALRSVRTTPS
ncbi:MULTISPECIES: wax ester/triacylglycerol synthase domain-containing protein [unclassified Nocardia]|uniref:wax ester/triacylglycerol synthase domain-containing protein n=1 Tax=unclassified Nocardia TaxID=2637762 RepID=UPI0024A7EC57|nr:MULTISPECIES: wax ester/triacylglycerol synthase domain-containing protein [unclassified Nocardia]